MAAEPTSADESLIVDSSKYEKKKMKKKKKRCGFFFKKRSLWICFSNVEIENDDDIKDRVLKYLENDDHKSKRTSLIMCFANIEIRGRPN
ncbi:hypothetical protein M0R45_014657 [Rubus argutus]|uniref:Uncharacterized protein n=1 Tax=Rubus argutus TaxID=59490 RepID=A0AAW1XPS3_RUBAR